MKYGKAAIALALVGGTDAATVRETPMSKVASLLIGMKARIVADGKAEQMSYDKFACWCEDTTQRKAEDISNAKKQIKDLGESILSLKGNLGSRGANIGQLEKDVGENEKAQGDAKAVRDKESNAYEAAKGESEQCIGALEAAIRVLTGAGEGSGNFLETRKQVELMSVVAGVRTALEKVPGTASTSNRDLDVVRRFVANPEVYFKPASALQTAHNPFGDYAPQSTQIQGILKGMYDAFVADLEKDNAEEAESQKSFEEFIATKEEELGTLQTELQRNKGDDAREKKQLAEDNTLRDDTEEQLDADEEFFADTKDACKKKAREWAERSRLRAEELTGVNTAIELLTDPKSQAIFNNATTTFLQVGSSQHKHQSLSVASKHFEELVHRYHTLSLAQVAAKVKAGGHFDEIIFAIDKMMADLRKEEQEDIDHRDRCQNGVAKNKADTEDLQAAIAKAGTTVERLKGDKSKLTGKISTVEQEIEGLKGDMQTLLQARNEEVARFRASVKSDTEAIEVISAVMRSLASFYKKNKIPLSFTQKREPEYTVDPDKAPETSWSGGDYGGRKEETGGIMAALDMIKEDLEKEIKTSKVDDAEAQKEYEKQKEVMVKGLEAREAMKIEFEKNVADIDAEIADVEAQKELDQKALNGQNQLETDLTNDCGPMIITYFASRRVKRKAEMDGLVEAKGYLAGMTDSTD